MVTSFWKCDVTRAPKVPFHGQRYIDIGCHLLGLCITPFVSSRIMGWDVVHGNCSPQWPNFLFFFFFFPKRIFVVPSNTTFAFSDGYACISVVTMKDMYKCCVRRYVLGRLTSLHYGYVVLHRCTVALSVFHWVLGLSMGWPGHSDTSVHPWLGHGRWVAWTQQTQ